MEPEKDVAFPLYLRIPGWCKRPQITVNGAQVPATPDGKGFVKIARTWAKGDVVELQFPMEPRVVRGYETEFPSANRKYFDFEPAAVFQPRRLPYASVLYGPLLFALPIPDVDPNTPVKDAKWQYALDTDAGRRDAGITGGTQADARALGLAAGRPGGVDVPAQAFDWKPTDAQALPDQAGDGNRVRNRPPRPLRLHQVPHLDVPRDAEGDGQRGEIGVGAVHQTSCPVRLAKCRSSSSCCVDPCNPRAFRSSKARRAAANATKAENTYCAGTVGSDRVLSARKMSLCDEQLGGLLHHYQRKAA